MLVNVRSLVGRHSQSRCIRTKSKKQEKREKRETKLFSSPHSNSRVLFHPPQYHAVFIPRARQEKREKRENLFFSVTLHSYQERKQEDGRNGSESLFSVT